MKQSVLDGRARLDPRLDFPGESHGLTETRPTVTDGLLLSCGVHPKVVLAVG